MPQNEAPRLGQVLVWSSAAWLGVGIARGILRVALQAPPNAAKAVLAAVIYDAYWIPATLALWMVVHGGVRATRRGSRIALVATFSAAAWMLFIPWDVATTWLFSGHVASAWTLLVRTSDTVALNVAAILVAAYAHLAFVRFTGGQATALRLAAELADARVQMLTSQLQPHFVFNTLHLISEVVHVDRAGALEVTRNLDELLAQSVAYSDRRQVPLHEELSFLEAYARIQERRFRGRLSVELAVAPGLTDVMIPHLLLQPLVENAIKHGVGARRGRGRVSVGAALRGNEVRLTITDDGVGMPEESVRREGLGLRNTRLRLQHLYGKDYRLSIEAAEPRGTRVLVDLPRRDGSNGAASAVSVPEAPVARESSAGGAPSGLNGAPNEAERSVLTGAGGLALVTVGALALWGLAGLAMTGVGLSVERASGTTGSPLASLGTNLTSMAVWCVLTPVVAWLAQRFRFGGQSPRPTLAVHVMAAPMVAGVHMLIWWRIADALGYGPLTSRNVPVAPWVMWDLLAYALVVALVHFRYYVRARRESEAEAARLRFETAQAHEDILRMRLQPRVLSAVLRAIARLAERDAERCDVAVSRAGDFLRLLLRTSSLHQGSIAQESELCRAFLDVLQVEHEGRWSYELRHPAGTASVAVPSGSILATLSAIFGDGGARTGHLVVDIRSDGVVTLRELESVA